MRKLVFNSKEEEEAYLITTRLKMNERSTLWQNNNRAQAYINSKKWRDANREKLNEIARMYRAENKEKYLANKRRTTSALKINNPLFKFSEKVRALTCMSFKRGNKKFIKTTKTEEILGCSIEFFVDYILQKCPEGVKIQDFQKYGYHLDHIIPISSAKTVEDVIKLSHYTNYQPLWWLDNIKKSNK